MVNRLHRRFLPWLIHHALEFKWMYLGALSCLFILQNLQAELPQRIRILTEQMTGLQSGESSVWLFLGLALGILIFRTLSRLLFFYPARIQQKNLRMELLGYLEQVQPERYEHRNQGQLFQILFDDINYIRAFVGFGLLQIGNLIIAAWVLIPRFSETDAYLWPAFIPLFSSVVFFSVMTFINQKIFKKMMDKKGEVQQFIIETYEAKQTIKNFHREDSFIDGFLKLSGEELTLFFKSSLGPAITGPYVKLGLGASLLLGGMLIKAKNGSPSDLVFFAGYLYLFLEPVMFLSWVAVVVSQGVAAWKRIKELYHDLHSSHELGLEQDEVLFEGNGLRLASTLWGHKKFLNFKRNSWTVLVGETGCGKSYALRQLASLLANKKIKVSMVQQEPYLFNDTIAENIFLGATPSEDNLKLVKELLVMFQLDSLAASLDKVLALEVGENGKRLSGGQIKRVALVRSLMSSSDILIWDDPFSSIDIILEKKIMSALKSNSFWHNKFFIISSHRLTTVRLSDDLYFIEKSLGVTHQGAVKDELKEKYAEQFFKEQLLEASVASP